MRYKVEKNLLVDDCGNYEQKIMLKILDSERNEIKSIEISRDNILDTINSIILLTNIECITYNGNLLYVNKDGIKEYIRRDLTCNFDHIVYALQFKLDEYDVKIKEVIDMIMSIRNEIYNIVDRLYFEKNTKNS